MDIMNTPVMGSVRVFLEPNRTEPNEFSFKTGKKIPFYAGIWGKLSIGICRHQNPLKHFDLQFWISKFKI